MNHQEGGSDGCKDWIGLSMEAISGSATTPLTSQVPYHDEIANSSSSCPSPHTFRPRTRRLDPSLHQSVSQSHLIPNQQPKPEIMKC